MVELCPARQAVITQAVSITNDKTSEINGKEGEKEEQAAKNEHEEEDKEGKMDEKAEYTANNAGALSPTTSATNATVSTKLLELVRKIRQEPHTILQSTLAYFMHRISKKMNVTLGQEFVVAATEARRAGSLICLGDRPIHITLSRAWHRLTFFQQILLPLHMIAALLVSSLRSRQDLELVLNQLKDDQDFLLTTIDQMSKFYPSLIDTLIRERDIFMISALRKCGMYAQNHAVVAVVGRGHQSGITRDWNTEFTKEHIALIERTPNVQDRLGIRRYAPVISGIILAIITLLLISVTLRYPMTSSLVFLLLIALVNWQSRCGLRQLSMKKSD